MWGGAVERVFYRKQVSQYIGQIFSLFFWGGMEHKQ